MPKIKKIHFSTFVESVVIEKDDGMKKGEGKNKIPWNLRCRDNRRALRAPFFLEI